MYNRNKGDKTMEQTLEQLNREQIARKIDAEITKLLAETAKINAETPKIMAETLKISTEAHWYPFITGAGAGAALLAGLIGLFKLIFF
jgi:aspartate-semialdehyde dehydrogenase